MLTEAMKGCLARGARTRIGQHLVIAAVLRDPRLARLDTVAAWPESLSGFEDLAFLFSPNRLNHSVISMQIDEAALLYRLVRSLGGGTVVEIGRFKGGSTLLMATALAPGGELWSYDVHAPLEGLSGAELDRSLTGALRRYGLEDRVRVVVADSKTAQPPPRPCDLVLIDGDHCYQGVRGDWEAWRDRVRPGGHVLFHDAVDTGRFGAYVNDVARLVAELERDEPGWERQPGAGAVAHFVRRNR